MMRPTLLGLMLPLALATPAFAQDADDMGSRKSVYGPVSAPAKKARPASRPNPSATVADTSPFVNRDGHRLIAAEEFAPRTILGLGMFRVTRPQRPDAAAAAGIRQSRIVAVGLSTKF